MPAPLLPQLETFTAQIDPRPMWLSGTPSSVMDGAKKYLKFADQADDAARLLRSLNTADFQGSEAEKFRSKLDSHLPDWLTKAATAHRNVGLGIKAFGAVFTTQHTLMTSIRTQAPGSHQAVQTAAHNVNRLEGELTAAEGAEATASGNLAQAKVAVTAAAATPGLPAAVANESQADAAFTAAEAHTNAVRAELAAAWTHYHAMMAVWNGLLTQANGVHEAMETASVTAKGIVDKEHDTPFEKNPSGWDAFWKGVGDWIDSHADILGKISELLTFVGSILMMFPGLGTIIGGALVGIGLAISAALVLTGNRSWGQFAMDAVGAIPGVGKLGELGKLGKLASESKFAKGVKNVFDCGEPVDAASGHLIDTEVDLRIDAAFPFILERSHISSFGAGRWFGPSWCSTIDSRVEIDAEGISVLTGEAAVLRYPHPLGDAEVLPEIGTMPLSFVDGAYRVRDVRTGVTYEYAMFGETSSLESASVVGEATIVGILDMSLVVGLSAIVHHTGHRIDVEYDAHTGYLSRMLHSGGAIVEVATDDMTGLVTQLSVYSEDSNPIVARRFEYSPANNLVAVTNWSGRAMRYEYDAQHRLTGWIDRNGHAYRHRYDVNGRVVVQAGSGGVYANAFVYLQDIYPGAPAGGRMLALIESVTELDSSIDGPAVEARLDRLASLPLASALGERGLGAAGIAFVGDAGGVEVRPDEASVSLFDEVLGKLRVHVYRSTSEGDVWQHIDPAGGSTTYRHRAHDVVSVIDPVGGETVIERDEFGAVTATVGPDGVRSATQFGTLGVPVRQVDPLGRVTEIELDAAGNVVGVVDPAGRRTGYEFDYRATGSVLSEVVDSSGLVTEVTCDDAGRPILVVEPGARAWTYVYDVFGNVVESTDPDGNTTSQVWNADHLLVSLRNSDGTTQFGEYDGEGNLVAAVDEAGHRVTAEFGPMDLPIVSLAADGGRLRMSYSTQGEPIAVTNPDGDVWEFDRDRAGRVRAETDFNGAMTSYTYDLAGRGVMRIDALGRRSETVYDAAGRVVRVVADDDVKEFVFNAAGEIMSAVNGDARVEYVRDDAGRVIRESVNAVSVSWEEAPDRTSVTRRVDGSGLGPAGGVWTTVFGFDPDGLIGSVVTTGPDGGVGGASGVDGLRFSYDRVGRESGRAIGASSRVEFGYDARSRLTSLQIGSAGGGGGGAVGGRRVVGGRRWSYRADSYVESLTELVSGRTSRFGLDAVGRVCSVSADGVGGERYGYSAAGVLAASGGADASADGVASSPVAGAARVGGSERVGSSGTLVTRAGRSRYSYDAAGQLVTIATSRLSRKPALTRFEYSSTGQIRAVVASDGTRWRYGYDAFGRRVSKCHTSADGGVLDSVVFGWDGDDLAVQVNTAHTSRGGMGAGGASAWVWTYHPVSGEPLEQHGRHFSPGERRRGAVSGEMPQGRVDAEFFAIVADLNGAPTELIDPVTGEVAGRASASVWGQARWVGASTVLRFAGQQYDAETGLHYNRYRYYNPVTSAYTSTDPLGVAPNPASATAYVHNPYTWIDPLGLKMCGGVYGLFDKSTGELKYIGKATNFASRRIAHKANPFRSGLDFRQLETISGRTSSARDLRSGVEQVYMNHFPQTQSNGQMGNLIRGLSQSGPNAGNNLYKYQIGSQYISQIRGGSFGILENVLRVGMA
ncbi:RHS repeat protein [Gordonia sp. TBRC 11910]|uniref:RHS repeat protein n=1 Tax=Gordonia asplenii TaxID=2725283 RepID=A0A848KQH1_9ACTN|nr:RHS repeat-associated core domain-containing protein [Gordonia asplenii]NMO00482.1 RHS repeat protein [Gordonia asplenii]